MARFAKVINNKIINVISADQAHINSLSDKEFYVEDDGNKVNPAMIGGTYDSLRDAFINKKPHPSWVLNETTCRFEAPIAYPADGSREKNYEWNEETTSWEEVV
jgi:hypothetical protein